MTGLRDGCRPRWIFIPDFGAELRKLLFHDSKPISLSGIGGEVDHLVRIGLQVVELPFLRLFPEMNQLPAIGANSAVLTRAVFGRILVVLVEERVAPAGRL